jgi:hypothetical protein
MPKDKDLKRLVRARMAKTGESYTAARAHITGSQNAVKAPKASWPELAGQRDQVMKEKTGRTWAEWVDALDAVGATEMSHTEIAKHVHEELGVPGWWAQTVTVGYERIRGLRATHQRRDGEFEASKSKTFPVPLSALYRACADERLRDRWLEGVALTVRASTKDKSMRLTWPDATSVELYFTDKGPQKSAVAVMHRKLASADAVAKAKAFWAERLSALAEALKAG